jgi:hypothetical protein
MSDSITSYNKQWLTKSSRIKKCIVIWSTNILFFSLVYLVGIDFINVGIY